MGCVRGEWWRKGNEWANRWICSTNLLSTTSLYHDLEELVEVQLLAIETRNSLHRGSPLVEEAMEVLEEGLVGSIARLQLVDLLHFRLELEVLRIEPTERLLKSLPEAKSLGSLESFGRLWWHDLAQPIAAGVRSNHLNVVRGVCKLLLGRVVGWTFAQIHRRGRLLALYSRRRSIRRLHDEVPRSLASPLSGTPSLRRISSSRLRSSPSLFQRRAASPVVPSRRSCHVSRPMAAVKLTAISIFAPLKCRQLAGSDWCCHSHHFRRKTHRTQTTSCDEVDASSIKRVAFINGGRASPASVIVARQEGTRLRARVEECRARGYGPSWRQRQGNLGCCLRFAGSRFSTGI
jgi:hypothetical protein